MAVLGIGTTDTGKPAVVLPLNVAGDKHILAMRLTQPRLLGRKRWRWNGWLRSVHGGPLSPAHPFLPDGLNRLYVFSGAGQPKGTVILEAVVSGGKGWRELDRLTLDTSKSTRPTQAR